MKKLIVLLLLVFMVGCNPATTTDNPTTNVTTEETSALITTIISGDITLYLNNGIDTVEVNSTWEDAGAYIMINDVRYEMTTEMNVDISKVDIYQIIYTYDFEEETYSIVRYVAVLDQTQPVLSLNPGIDTITVGGTWLDAGVEASDNSGEAVVVTTTGTVDTTTIGSYEIIYEATDSSGNSSVITRYVNVVE